MDTQRNGVLTHRAFFNLFVSISWLCCFKLFGKAAEIYVLSSVSFLCFPVRLSFCGSLENRGLFFQRKDSSSIRGDISWNKGFMKYKFHKRGHYTEGISLWKMVIQGSHISSYINFFPDVWRLVSDHRTIQSTHSPACDAVTLEKRCCDVERCEISPFQVQFLQLSSSVRLLLCAPPLHPKCILLHAPHGKFFGK